MITTVRAGHSGRAVIDLTGSAQMWSSRLAGARKTGRFACEGAARGGDARTYFEAYFTPRFLGADGLVTAYLRAHH